MNLIYALQVSTNEIKDWLTIKDVSIIGILLVLIGYFIYENWRIKKELSKAIEERVNDLKESNKYSEIVMQQFNSLANDLKDMIRNIK